MNRGAATGVLNARNDIKKGGLKEKLTFHTREVLKKDKNVVLWLFSIKPTVLKRTSNFLASKEATFFLSFCSFFFIERKD